MTHAEPSAPRVLIVDDDPFLFEIAGRYLPKAGMSVRFADRALRASLRDHRPT